MNTRTTISSGFRWRLALIAVAMFGFGAYCLYDGIIAYPHQKEVYDSYQRIRAEHPRDYHDMWLEYAGARGWSTDVPHERTDTDILTQFVMAAIVLPIGLFFGIGYLRSFQRYVAMDEHGLTANGNRKVAWDQIESLDTTRWSTKGIAVVHYRDGENAEKILLDDWKFERDPTRAIKEAVQRHIDPDADLHAGEDDASAAPQGEAEEPRQRGSNIDDADSQPASAGREPRN